MSISTIQEFRSRYPIKPNEPTLLLGSGSYGKVVKVEDQIETEWVAVKIGEYRGDDAKSLKAEVELAQKVPRHANIARYDACYRLETDTGRCDFAIMKYYPDGNLAQLLKSTPLTITQKEEIVRGILLGLQHLHKHRIVHRDFKPANILISRDNQGKFIPKIADFGLSKLVNEDEIESSDFDLSDGRGTPSYKAPEQIEGGKVSFNLDLWALGVILYEIFVGEKPFGSDIRIGSEQSLRREIEMKIVTVTLPTKLTNVPQPYQTMIRRCLVKDIHKRVRKEQELLKLLDEALPVSQPPSHGIEKPEKVFIQEPDAQTDVFAESILIAEQTAKPSQHWLAFVPQIAIGLTALLFGVMLFRYFTKPDNTPPIDVPAKSTTIIKPTKIATKNQTPETKRDNRPEIGQALQQAKQAMKSENWKLAKKYADKVLNIEPDNKQAQQIQNLLIAQEEQQKREATINQVEEQKYQNQLDYDNLIDRGIAAIENNNNKSAAISYFGQAKQLADKNGLSTTKSASTYSKYLAKANKIFASEDYEAAKAWYQVAQALNDTPEVRKQLKECSILSN